MIAIFKRELIDYLQSIQIVALLCITIIMFSASGFISNRNYQQQIGDYLQHTRGEHPNPRTDFYGIYRKPSILQFMAEGNVKFLPSGYVLQPMGRLEPEESSLYNKILPELPEIDWSLIIKFIFSLFAILLGYSAVAGEKEMGTLRLMMSNAISRVNLLTAKYLAILFALIIPLSIGALIGLIINSILNPEVLTLSNISRVVVFCVLAVIYISIFIFLSLLFSSLINPSSLALFMLLAIWVFLVIVIPNLSGILAEQLVKVSSEYQEREKIHSLVGRPANAKINQELLMFAKGEIKTEDELWEKTEPIIYEAQKKYLEQEAVYMNRVNRQADMTRLLCRLSPVGLFQYAGESISQTGNENDEWFQKNVRQYSKEFDKYVLKKVGKLNVFIDELSVGSTIEHAGKLINIAPQMPIRYRGDMHDFPHFVDKEPTLVLGLKNSLLNVAILLIWNIMLAILAYRSILCADVR